MEMIVMAFETTERTDAEAMKIRADQEKDMAKAREKAEKDKAKNRDEFVNECQFEGHELQENMADAKARAELTRPDVKGECEEK